MGRVSPPPVRTQQCRYLMPLMAIPFLLIKDIQKGYKLLHGHPIANASPPPVPILRYRFGMLTQDKMSTFIMATMMRYKAWHGHPMEHALLLRATMCKFGTPQMGETSCLCKRRSDCECMAS